MDTTPQRGPRERFMLLGLHAFGDLAEPVCHAVVDRIRLDGRRLQKVRFDDKRRVIKEVWLKPNSVDIHMIHEFGHCMHCHYWPELSAKCWPSKAERVAFWSELRLLSLEHDNGAALARGMGRLRTIRDGKGIRGVHKAAARWLIEHIDDYHPMRGVEWPGPALLERMEAVFNA